MAASEGIHGVKNKPIFLYSFYKKNMKKNAWAVKIFARHVDLILIIALF